MQQLQKEEQVNYHFVEINGLNYKVINQLDEKKHVSNFYLPKKLVRQHPTRKDSYKVKIYDKFICVPKIMCFIDKTGKYFLVGIDMFFTYWIYNTRDNNKYRLAGYQAIKDTAIKELHYLTVSARRYEKEQATNPFLSGLTYQQAREQICAESDKLKAEYQTYVQSKYSANNIKKSSNRENNSLIDKFNTHYEKNKGDPPKLSEEELDQLLVELDNLD
ncbi:hypothetical protein [Spiroplasma melliferum]|uniref:Uncharacterized protein n=2 Tax=Spiroplasma melliferum TaxID=2134 RepID=A0AAI9T255_SPIME|nr:hypothetical protein [Spiroplasma melliferum]KAI92000.1 hypothetical protein SPM_006690 [Spiroplasma melliferum KC3]QCO23226.1 hypothetical protein SRED_003088 [Spiroplasma melliferum]QCO23239.1 hypothetical protein SRED_003101 [Spiroplasma melliferum]QCO23253.1 hypothetical protein SRED_003115 [Spiroplasma melliferum]